ncbi:hypothetical protein SDC9_154825 [bioreactor metagenome]|uniref:Uncharacterized protein n=1 Tax=bioreactor metagenome TaxID=1076179 RepID=A0A645F4L6_9ZZZZ
MARNHIIGLIRKSLFISFQRTVVDHFDSFTFHTYQIVPMHHLIILVQVFIVAADAQLRDQILLRKDLQYSVYRREIDGDIAPFQGKENIFGRYRLSAFSQDRKDGLPVLGLFQSAKLQTLIIFIVSIHHTSSLKMVCFYFTDRQQFFLSDTIIQQPRKIYNKITGHRQNDDGSSRCDIQRIGGPQAGYAEYTA